MTQKFRREHPPEDCSWDNAISMMWWGVGFLLLVVCFFLFWSLLP